MALNIVIITLLLLCIGIIAYISRDIRKDMAIRKSGISFRESIDLTNLPIVTFRQGDKRFNFILDTGATDSIVNKPYLKYIKHTKTQNTYKGYGIEGKEQDMSEAQIKLEYKGMDYIENFRVLDMTESLNLFKSDYGVIVHGLLASSFFEKYKYIIDYNDMIAYTKSR